MTLWHAGTLLACWHTYWHSRQTHGTGRLMMMAQPSHSGSLRLTSRSGQISFSGWCTLWWMQIWVRTLRNQSNPINQKIWSKWPKTRLWKNFNLNKLETEPNKPNKLNNQFIIKVRFFYQICDQMGLKLDISDLDIPLRLSTWLDRPSMCNIWIIALLNCLYQAQYWPRG